MTRADLWTEILHHAGTDMRAPAWEVRLMRQLGDEPVEIVESMTCYTQSAAMALGEAMLKSANASEDEYLRWKRNADRVDGYDRDDLGESEDW